VVGIVLIGLIGCNSPPKPVDEFQAKIQTAYAVDHGQPAQRDALIAVYTNAPVNAATWGELVVAMKVNSLPPEQLTTTRKVIADELEKTLGNDPSTPMTDEFRQAVANEFAKIVNALKKV
jgi:hypothetical protein